MCLCTCPFVLWHKHYQGSAFAFLLVLPVVHMLNKDVHHVEQSTYSACRLNVLHGWRRWLSIADYQQIITSHPQTWTHFFFSNSYRDIDLWPFVQWGNDQPRSLLVLITNADSNPWLTKGQSSRDSTLKQRYGFFFFFNIDSFDDWRLKSSLK